VVDKLKQKTVELENEALKAQVNNAKAILNDINIYVLCLQSWR